MDPGEAEWGGVAWIDLTHGRDTWRAHVNAMGSQRHAPVFFTRRQELPVPTG